MQLRSFRQFILLGIVALFIGSLAFSGHGYAKEKKKAKTPAVAESHRFFAFDGAPYYTSPDKRVGCKMLIDSTKVGPTLAAMQHLTFLPTAHIPSHRHVYVTEVVYVLKGNLTLRIDKEIKILGPDATAYIPPQTFHEYKNDSGDVCQFLQFYSPSGPEEEYRNWEIPGQEKKTAVAPAKATETEVIHAPPIGVIPGSPLPVLGGVKQVESSNVVEPSDAAVKAAASSSSPISLMDFNKKGYKLELKKSGTASPSYDLKTKSRTPAPSTRN